MSIDSISKYCSTNTGKIAAAAVATIAVAYGAYEIYKRIINPFTPLQNKPKAVPFSYVPTTCSEAAQQYLRTAIPVECSVTDLKICKRIRAGYQAETQKASDAAKATYLESVKMAKIEGVPVLIATPKGYIDECSRFPNILIYLHEGGFSMGRPEHLIHLFAQVAYKAHLQVYAIDYSLAPEKPFPQALDDCFLVYKKLIATLEAKTIYVLGSSSGGNLAIAMLLKAKKAGLAMPQGLGLYSPFVELGKKGDTRGSLEGIDPKLHHDKSLAHFAAAYLGRADISNPLISVLKADLRGFPQTQIQTGTRDLLLSDCARLDTALNLAKVPSHLIVTEGMWHNYHAHAELPEAQASANRMADFFLTQAQIAWREDEYRPLSSPAPSPV